MKLDHLLNHVRETKNTPITMQSIITSIISTQRGWAIRQATKGALLVSAFATTWLSDHGVITDGQTLAAALVSLAVGLAEYSLSKLASRIAAQ